MMTVAGEWLTWGSESLTWAPERAIVYSNKLSFEGGVRKVKGYSSSHDHRARPPWQNCQERKGNQINGGLGQAAVTDRTEQGKMPRAGWGACARILAGCAPVCSPRQGYMACTESWNPMG